MQATSDDDDDDDEDSPYEPEYETEIVWVDKDAQLSVLTVVPPPLEYLAALRQDRHEISGRKVWTGSLLLARFLRRQVSTGSLSLDGLRYASCGCRVVEVVSYYLRPNLTSPSTATPSQRVASWSSDAGQDCWGCVWLGWVR
jgi:hypothetical protein